MGVLVILGLAIFWLLFGIWGTTYPWFSSTHQCFFFSIFVVKNGFNSWWGKKKQKPKTHTLWNRTTVTKTDRIVPSPISNLEWRRLELVQQLDVLRDLSTFHLSLHLPYQFGFCLHVCYLVAISQVVQWRVLMSLRKTEMKRPKLATAACVLLYWERQCVPKNPHSTFFLDVINSPELGPAWYDGLEPGHS